MVILGGKVDRVANQFPFPVGLTVTGVEPVGEYGRAGDYVTVVPADCPMMEEKGTCLLPRLAGSVDPSLYATFAHAAPDRDAAYALAEMKAAGGAAGPSQEDTYFLPPTFEVFVQREVATLPPDDMRRHLGIRGVFPACPEKGRNRSTATAAGIHYIRKKVAAIKARLPTVHIDRAYVVAAPADCASWTAYKDAADKMVPPGDDGCDSPTREVLEVEARFRMQVCYPDICQALMDVITPLYVREAEARESRRAIRNAKRDRPSGSSSRRSKRGGRYR